MIGFARSYTHQPSSALGLARVISRFNGLAVPGVGINFNRSYLDRANIVKFMRTGLLLALSFSLSLSLSLFLAVRRLAEKSSLEERVCIQRKRKEDC